jgi:2-amino-1-hydroxyethylphosphonate dioxygenase (glycine-forming)
MTADEVIEQVFSLYSTHGNEDYIGEPVSQLEHMLQAGELAREEGYDDEVVLAAFFHDIGHLLAFEGEAGSMDGYGLVSHESKGAEFLRRHGFSERIAMLVESHVEAKRYLTYKHPEYDAKLSEASRKTLEFQGGMMDKEEAEKFEQDPVSELKIKLRLWDDEAKEVEPTSQTLEFFKELARKQLELKSASK